MKYEYLPFAVATLEKGRIVSVNKAYVELFGLASEQEAVRAGLKQILTQDSNKKFKKELSEQFDDKFSTIQLKGVTKEGNKIELEIGISPPSQDEALQQLLTFRNISQEKNTVAFLEEQLKQYQSFFTHTSKAQVVLREGKILVANPSFYQLFSIPAETDLKEKDIADLIDPDAISQFQSLCKKILSGKVITGEFEHKAYRSEGQFFDARISINLLKLGSEKLLLLNYDDVTSVNIEKAELHARANEWSRIDGIISDLGEISELGELLKVLTERLTDITHFHHYGMYLGNAANTQLELKLHRALSQELIDKISVLPFEEGIGGYLHKTLEPHCFDIAKYPSYLPFRSMFKNADLDKIAFIPFVSKSKLYGAILLATKNKDIESPSNHILTLIAKHGGEALARVATFEQLKNSEEEYRYSVEQTDTVLYKLSATGKFDSLNSAIERLTGHTTKEFFRTTSLWLSLIHPDDKKLILERQTKLQELTGPYTIEYRIRPKGKAAYRWVRDTIVPIKVDGDAPGRLEGSLTDITEYKNTIVDLQKTTEQINIEQQLSHSDEMLRNVIDTMEDVLMITDLEGNVIQVNTAFERMIGYSLNEAAGTAFPYPWLDVEETGKYVLWMSNLQANTTIHDFDMTWKTKQGKTIDMSICSTILRSVEKEPNAVLTIARDISERKRLSRELEERNNQVELLNRIMMAAEHSTNFDEIFSNIAAELKMNLSFDDINIELIADPGMMVEVLACEGVMADTKGMLIPIEQTISQFTVRGRQPVIIANMDEHEEYARLDSFRFGIRSQISLPIITKGRILGTFNIGSVTPDTYREIQTKGLQLVAQQLGVIIDRVKLFNKVSEDAGYIRNLLDSIDNVVYTIGTDHQILEVNRAWNDFLSAYNVPIKKEYHGAKLFDVLPDDELKLMLQKVTGDVLSGSVRYFSQEIVLHSADGDRTYQVTINPLIIDRKITGLVISHSDITELRHTALELKNYSDKLLTLNTIALRIQESRSVDEVLTTSLPLLQKTIGADAVVVYLKEEGTGDLILSAHTDLEQQALNHAQRLPSQSSATGNVMRTKQPLFIQKKVYNDARLLPQLRELLLQNTVEAIGIIPLSSRQQVYGAIHVLYREQRPFTDQLCQILTLVSNQLGSAIESVQLYKQLQAQVDQLSVMYGISQHLTSTLEIERIFEIVVEHVQRVIPFEKLAIGLYDEKNNELINSFEIAQYAGKAQIFSKTPERRPIDASSPEWQAVISKTTSVIENDRLLFVPMLSKEKIYGIMSLSLTSQSSHSIAQVRLLESIANLVAIALEKGKLYHETVQKTIEIERRNKELDDFTYVVSHDLKEPLISIEGFSQILNVDYGEGLQAEGKEYLDSIVAASGRMKGLIDDLLMLSRISRPTESFKPIPLGDVINEIRADFEYTLNRKNALLVIEDPLPVVLGNRSHLKILFQNLISNAIKFNNQERPIVEVGFQNTENNSYLFFVRDNGIGIEKDFQQKIFVIFQRLHPREEYEGSGAGLAIVKKIVEMHNGTIWVESVPGQGSTFYFTLPK